MTTINAAPAAALETVETAQPEVASPALDEPPISSGLIHIYEPSVETEREQKIRLHQENIQAITIRVGRLMTDQRIELFRKMLSPQARGLPHVSGPDKYDAHLLFERLASIHRMVPDERIQREVEGKASPSKKILVEFVKAENALLYERILFQALQEKDGLSREEIRELENSERGGALI